MTKRTSIRLALVTAIGFLMTATAFGNTITGHVTAFTPTTVSVRDREVVTVGFNKDTVFTKLVTQKPWQEAVALTPKALRVGGYVVVHVPEGTGVANWVQLATDRPLVAEGPIVYTPVTASLTTDYRAEAARHRAEARMRRAAPNASESKRPGSPDTALHCDRMADKLEKAGK